MDKQEITVVACHPGKRAEITKIASSLEDMQAFVGGYIQAVYPFEDPVALICNEEAKMIGLEPNRALRDKESKVVYDIIAGSFFIADCSGETFDSLSQEQQDKYRRMFEKPEHFLKLGGRILVIPMEEQGKRQTETQKSHRPRM